MKNKLIKGLFGFGLGLSLFATLTGVNAEGDITSVEEGSNSASSNVVVGNVEAPVYSVYIYWENMSFDWLYNEDKEDFGWLPSAVCGRFDSSDRTVEEALNNGEDIYTNDNCSTKAETYEDETQYYEKMSREKVTIGIDDMSQNGQIVPSIKWAASDKYNNVIGKFSYTTTIATCALIDSEEMFNYAKDNDVTLYNDSNCLTIVNDENIAYAENQYYALVNITDAVTITGGEIPDSARYSGMGGMDSIYHFAQLEDFGYPKIHYTMDLKLENDPEKEVVTPVAGDTIGTITISIRAK